MTRGAVRIAVAQPVSAIASLAGAIHFPQHRPESDNLITAAALAREAAASGARLLAFPELFPGPSVPAGPLAYDAAAAAMGALAAETGLCIGWGGLRPAPGGGRHNAYHLVDGPSGRAVVQDKVLPAMGEDAAPGSGHALIDLGGLRVAAAICWEAWFPELVRTRVLAGADLVLFPTGAVVQATHGVWRALVGTRAAESTSFACSVNLLGVERGMGAVFGPEGMLGARDDAGLVVADLDLARLDALRAADDEITTLKRFATLPGLMRALPGWMLRDEAEALGAVRRA